MIGLNWKKSLVAGAALAALVAVPAMSLAKTPYPVVTPPSVAMADTVVAKPVKKVAVHHKTAKKAVKKTTGKFAKHKTTKKHKTVATKKKLI
jgi:hypothetical protein